MKRRLPPFRTHLLTLLVIGAFAVLGAGTGESDGDGSSDDDESAASSAALHALEGHLSRGQAYGEGPGGDVLAAAMRDMLDADIGDALAIHVTPGSPERIVVILKLPDLRDFSDGDRQEWLDSFGELVRSGFGATDAQIVVGIRGNVFFGAVAQMAPGATTWSTETGSVVSTQPLTDALAAPSTPPAAGEARQDHYATITSDDARFDPEGEDEDEGEPLRADRYPLELAAGQAVTIRMHGPEIDPYLYLLSPAGEILAENDDSQDGLDSRIDFTATEAGTYTVVAADLGEEGGAYALRVRGAAPSAAAPSAAAPSAAE
jgi:hypothetical protein